MNNEKYLRKKKNGSLIVVIKGMLMTTRPDLFPETTDIGYTNSPF